MSLKKLLYGAARPLEIFVGLFFLAGAMLKAYDIDLFWKQIVQYGVLRQETWLDATAVGVVGLEAFLGAALVVGWRMRGLLHAAVALLLVGFTALIAYAWAYHDLADCGCLGKLEMTPGVSIAKNLVLFGFITIAYSGSSRTLNTAKMPAFLRASVIGIAVAVMGYAHFTLEPAPETDETRRFSVYAVEDAGQTLDLGEGTYLVVVLSATCEHCRASVPTLNELLVEPDLPLPVGLIYGEPEEIEDFRTVTQPFFPLKDITVRDFFSLIGAEPPRVYAIRDGVEQAHWDEIPSPEAIRAALE